MKGADGRGGRSQSEVASCRGADNGGTIGLLVEGAVGTVKTGGWAGLWWQWLCAMIDSGCLQKDKVTALDPLKRFSIFSFELLVLVQTNVRNSNECEKECLGSPTSRNYIVCKN